MRSVKTEADDAVMPGVDNFVTKKLLEELCLEQCQIAPLCFIKNEMHFYIIQISVCRKWFISAITVFRNRASTSIKHVHHAVCSPSS